MNETMLNYDHYDVPRHTQLAFEDYFIRGYPPGSFMMSVLTNDLIGAVTRCDSLNSEHLRSIVKWMYNNAPLGSWGSQEIVKDWLHDTNNIRTNFSNEVEKRHMWEKLQKV